MSGVEATRQIGADVIDRDDVVTRLLAQAAESLETTGVHKTTLAALLVAAAENPSSLDYPSSAFEVPVAALNDSLLRLRLDGKVELTRDGFVLTEQGRVESEKTATWPLAGFLKDLVGRKLLEWQIAPARA